jgi:hypothetical protein
MQRSDYIITNNLNIKKNSSVIKKDLLNWINPKYVVKFLESNEFNTKIKTSADKKSYIDGFTLGFDNIVMK